MSDIYIALIAQKELSDARSAAFSGAESAE